MKLGSVAQMVYTGAFTLKQAHAQRKTAQYKAEQVQIEGTQTRAAAKLEDFTRKVSAHHAKADEAVVSAAIAFEEGRRNAQAILVGNQRG